MAGVPGAVEVEQGDYEVVVVVVGVRSCWDESHRWFLRIRSLMNCEVLL